MTLTISEMFYSIQGEGIYVGQPSLFLRLKGCNLTCGGKDTVKTKMLDSNATWRCDTIEVWTKGSAYSFDSICLNWEENNWIHHLKLGAHLIITGGEPLLQQSQLTAFLNYFNTRYSFIPFIEIETNGTIAICAELHPYIGHYNVSLKLNNSGMKKENYFVKSAINSFTQQPNVTYKFVISQKSDITQCITTYIDHFNLPKKQVMLMPAASSLKSLKFVQEQLAEWCKEFNFRLSTRLHIAIWDQKTGI